MIFVRINVSFITLSFDSSPIRRIANRTRWLGHRARHGVACLDQIYGPSCTSSTATRTSSGQTLGVGWDLIPLFVEHYGSQRLVGDSLHSC